MNSRLINTTILSPNHSGPRTHAIDRISPHCVVGQCSIESLGSVFSKKCRRASSNYGIGSDGRVGLYVDEANRSWCTSSAANDQRAVTIECASDSIAPHRMNEVVYTKLVELCADICRRYGKKKLLWFGDKKKTLAYEPEKEEMVITVHRWFASKDCPGEWLYSRLGDLAARVTAELNKEQKVKVKIPNLNIRTGPGKNYPATGKFTGIGVFTIVEVKDGWGRLKSGAGWICMEFCEVV